MKQELVLDRGQLVSLFDLLPVELVNRQVYIIAIVVHISLHSV